MLSLKGRYIIKNKNKFEEGTREGNTDFNNFTLYLQLFFSGSLLLGKYK